MKKLLIFILSAIVSVTVVILCWDDSIYTVVSCSDMRDKLVRVEVPYRGFDNNEVRAGQLVVFEPVASHVKAAFAELLDKDFRIESMKWSNSSENEYGFKPAAPGKGALKMSGKTEAFVCRSVAGGSVRSLHSYGVAIDVNPRQNPMVLVDLKEKKIISVVPADGVRYLNRLEHPNKPARMGLITPEIAAIFAKHGFNHWGGYSEYSVEYMHFAISRRLLHVLMAMDQGDASRLFNIHVDICRKQPQDRIANDVVELMLEQYFPGGTVRDVVSWYRSDPEDFFEKAGAIMPVVW